MNRFASSSKLISLWGEPVSRYTVVRRLAKTGLKKYRCPLKPFLFVASKTARYQWCQRRVTWRHQQFQRVAWSDESRFRLFTNDARVRVWRHRGERLRSDLIRPRIQGCGGSIHVWGAIWHGGRSNLQVPRQSISGQSYCGVIRTFLDSN